MLHCCIHPPRCWCTTSSLSTSNSQWIMFVVIRVICDQTEAHFLNPQLWGVAFCLEKSMWSWKVYAFSGKDWYELGSNSSLNSIIRTIGSKPSSWELLCERASAVCDALMVAWVGVCNDPRRWWLPTSSPFGGCFPPLCGRCTIWWVIPPTSARASAVITTRVKC